MQVSVPAGSWCSRTSGPITGGTNPAVLRGSAVMNPPSAAVRNATLVLDVHVHQLTGGDLVTSWLGLAHGQAGGLVIVGQQRHRVSGEHAADRRTVQSQVIRDAVRAPAAGETQRASTTLGASRQLVRTAPGLGAVVG